jgi:fructokinase
MEPIASSVDRFVAEELPADTLLMVDPNCRPMTISDRDAYVARLSRICRRADIVKASVEDLAYLFPGLPADKAASALLEQGAGLVLVTDGARPSRGFLADGGEVGVDVPAVDVVDTIGAGDAFGGGFLASWIDASRTQGELRSPVPDTANAVAEALSVAVKVAAITCSRPGADPPSAGELA